MTFTLLELESLALWKNLFEEAFHDAPLTDVAGDPFPPGFFDADPDEACPEHGRGVPRETDPSASWTPPSPGVGCWPGQLEEQEDEA